MLQGVEVLLRNALHDQMTRWHAANEWPGMWFGDPAGLLERRCLDDIEEARRRLRRLGRPATPGRIVAELGFGFWRYLLTARYEQTLWTPALRHAFPGLRPTRRRTLADRVERIHYLRNRIAHHEPIHGRDLALDHADALAVVEAICPHARAWLGHTSLVPGTLAGRPLLN